MADDPLDDLTTEEKQALVNLVKNDNGFDLSRRDVLALAGGASLGAVLGGTGYSAMGSAKADASTSDSDGNVGLPNDPVDAWLEGLAGPTGSPIDLGSDIVPDTDASYDLGSASNQFANAYMSNAEVESLGDGRYYAGAFDGADADARLDNALSAANTGDEIYLESAQYTTQRTVGSYTLIGVGDIGKSSTDIQADWTLDNSVLNGADIADITVTHTGFGAIRLFRGSSGTTINVTGDGVLISDGFAGGASITFDSGTSRGIVDSVQQPSTITDNGTNTVGDTS